MTTQYAGGAYLPFSRWGHRRPLYWLGNPKKAVRALGDAPVAVRVLPSADPALAGRSDLLWFSYDPARWGERICITFQREREIAGPAYRWRSVARALWAMVRRDPRVTFADVPVDINDWIGEGLPADVFGFARRRGTRTPLLPVPNLLHRLARLPAPIPWDHKTDTLYFRGADTGLLDPELNSRMALCRLALGIPGGDCRLSHLLQFQGESERLLRAGILHKRLPIAEMNRHRYLVDVDGTSTSWDRYLYTGTFGGVPIRFEPVWEECWHGLLVDGENCVVADRHDLERVLAGLRAEPDRARRIAANASRLVAGPLGPDGVQAMFERAWRERLGDC